jgi:hypothetical protein
VYGDTWEEANDIMGSGMTVTAHDVTPWIKAGKAYGKEVGMPRRRHLEPSSIP